ncbi:MAG: DciA family protein [Alphaproteobacteria bacterium]|nr:DciA family protein [Alphaproteobacteria bacterium]
MAPQSHDKKGTRQKKRGFGPQAIARSLRPVARKGAGKRPPLLTDLTFGWPGIAGKTLGARTLPLKLTGGGRTPEGGRRAQTLILKVDGAWASEVNHQAALLIDRVNSYFGYRVIDRISLQQGYVPARAPERKKRPVPTPEVERRLDKLTGQGASDGLKASLTRLGERLLSGNAEK